MSDQLLPDFDGPGSQLLEQPSPRKPRPRPTRRPAKKAAKTRAPSLKPAKRVPKKRVPKKRVPKKRKVRKAEPVSDLKMGPPRLVVMFDAYVKITDLLKTLSDEEREAVMQLVMFAT